MCYKSQLRKYSIIFPISCTVTKKNQALLPVIVFVSSPFMRKITFLTCVLFFVSAAIVDAQEFSIAKYKGNSKSALSFTFDDGAADQGTIAVPELEKRGWRGTFWVIPANVDKTGSDHPMNWRRLAELSDRGHEVSNHGMTHVRLTGLGSKEVFREIHSADSAIASHTAKVPRTFCYPFNDRNKEITAAASFGRVGTRTFQYALGGRNTAADMDAHLKKNIEEGAWLVTMTHGILDGYDHFESLDPFVSFLDTVKVHEKDIWVGTFEQVAEYSALRDATSISVEDKGHNTFEIKLNCSLDPRVFTAPLTLCLDNVALSPRVYQDKQRLSCKGGWGHWTVDVNPFGGIVTVVAAKYIPQPAIDMKPTLTVKLYPKGQNEDEGVAMGPGESNGYDLPEFLKENGDLYNVGDSARFDVYLPARPNGQMVVITPGGGYAYSASINEGLYIAKMLNDKGIAAAVLHYRMPHGHYRVPLTDVQNTFRYCRAHAAEWGVKQIGILGGSAGGHLAAYASTMFVDDITRPDFSILYYPVITMDDRFTNNWTKNNLLGESVKEYDLVDKYSLENAVTDRTPRTFILFCEDDGTVPIENGIRYYYALRAHKIQSELHIYPHGGHGFGGNKAEYIGAGRDPFEYARPTFEASLFRWLDEISNDIK